MLQETWLVFRRAMIQSLRTPAWVVIGLGPPVLYLALFVPLLRSLKSEDTFAPIQNSVIVPVLLLSGILLPMSLAPGWLYTLSRFNPFVYVVDAERATFVGDLESVTVGLGVLAAAVLATLAVLFGARTFQRESA
ncbi:MAG: ABC transporter permease [Actinomycetota bacterium]|nr:ABC transporter permease [Actinomycetota bacterium]